MGDKMEKHSILKDRVIFKSLKITHPNVRSFEPDTQTYSQC